MLGRCWSIAASTVIRAQLPVQVAVGQVNRAGSRSRTFETSARGRARRGRISFPSSASLPVTSWLAARSSPRSMLRAPTRTP
eukprot:1205116-Pyramimonas_sp.AAC.1